MDEEYVKKSRLKSKEYYNNNREAVIKRVRAQQEKNKMDEMLLNLYELQKKGLINIHTANLNADQHKKLETRLLDRLKVLGIIEA